MDKQKDARPGLQDLVGTLAELDAHVEEELDRLIKILDPVLLPAEIDKAETPYDISYHDAVSEVEKLIHEARHRRMLTIDRLRSAIYRARI